MVVPRKRTLEGDCPPKISTSLHTEEGSQLQIKDLGEREMRNRILSVDEASHPFPLNYGEGGDQISCTSVSNF